MEQAKPSIPLEKILQKQRQFEVEYAHNSTALAGNSLTLEQTRTVLDAVDPPQDLGQVVKDSSPSEEQSSHQTMCDRKALAHSHGEGFPIFGRRCP